MMVTILSMDFVLVFKRWEDFGWSIRTEESMGRAYMDRHNSMKGYDCMIYAGHVWNTHKRGLRTVEAFHHCNAKDMVLPIISRST